MVRSFRVRDDDVETSLFSREFGTKLFDTHVFRTLYHPNMESFALNHYVVLIAELLLYRTDFFSREPGHDAVYECCAYIVVCVEPCLESFIVGSEILFPEVDIVVDEFLEVMAVLEDQLARHDDEAFLRITVECLVSCIEYLCEFCRIRSRGCH